jgi:PLP dependent protein
MNDVIQNNLKDIQQTIQEACEKSGRNPDSVCLVAVTKYAELEWAHALVDAGQLDLGESRPQQLEDRVKHFPDNIRWHMIGQLQRNKIRKILPDIHLIHSVNSLKLLNAINRIAEELSIVASVLLQVNISNEESKQGWIPGELKNQWSEIAECSNLNIKGLMTMAPLVDNPEDARSFFRKLRELRDELQDSSPSGIQLTELSMGMSRDYHVAVEEGATLIRIGSQLFTGLK